MPSGLGCEHQAVSLGEVSRVAAGVARGLAASEGGKWSGAGVAKLWAHEARSHARFERPPPTGTLSVVAP